MIFLLIYRNFLEIKKVTKIFLTKWNILPKLSL